MEVTVDRIIALVSAIVSAIALAVSIDSAQTPVALPIAAIDTDVGQAGATAEFPRATTQSDTDRLILLEAQVREVMAKLAQVQIATSTAKVEDATRERAFSSQGASLGEASVADVDPRLEEKFRAGSSTPVLDVAREQFAAEEVDTRWSASAEADVASLLSGRDLDVDSILCKSSYCRADILFRDHSVFESVLADFSNALPWASAAWFHQDQQAQSLHFELYFPRKKDAL